MFYAFLKTILQMVALVGICAAITVIAVGIYVAVNWEKFKND